MTAPTAPEPPTGEPPSPHPLQAPPAPTNPPPKFAGLAWSSLILGIVGVVFSPMPIINNLSALIAVVGIILALIALFGSRKVLAGIGAGLCVLAIVFTVAAQTALTKGLSGQGGTVGRVGGSGQQASNDAAQHIPFGQSFTYEDGTVVTIAAPTSYQPSSTALVGSGAARAVAMKVTVTNGTVKPLSLALVSIQATAGEQAVEQVFDSAQGIGGTPSQTLPSGKRQTFTVVFGLPPGPTELRVEVHPGLFNYQPVFFTGQM
jgi:hypothetical protein